MKLLYVTNSRFPSERAHMVQVVKMCNAFATNGFDVTLAVTNRPTEIQESPEEYFGEPLQFKIVRVPVIDAASHAARLPYWLVRLGYQMQRVSYVINLPAAETGEVIYGRDPIILFLLGVRFGFTRVAYESHEAHYNWFVRQLVRRGVKVITISEGIHDFYLAKGVPARQMIVAHDGIDESFFAPHMSQAEARRRLGLPLDKKIAMYIGGFDAWKGTHTFFQASTETDTICFVAIGGSAEQVASLQTQYPKVTFLGAQPYRDLVYNQQAADVLVIPNSAQSKVSTHYTSPLKLFAHMTAKRPLVVSDIPSLRVVLGDNAAVYFEADNGRDLCQKIMWAVAESGAVHPLTLSAYELAKLYTWDQRSAAIKKFLVVR